MLLLLLLFLPVIVVLLIIERCCKDNSFQLTGAHVLITGGSSGIGLSVAVQAVRQGANVTLLARNKDRLSEAKTQVQEALLNTTQKVICISTDLSRDYHEVEKAVRQAESEMGQGVDMLINSAGFSVSGRFEDIPLEDFKRLLEVNYLGSVYATRAVLQGMKDREKGRIVFVSSQAGQLGVYGFTAYSASKFALRGLAEALQMEVRPYKIRVCLSFPPDTDTPGYVEEMKTKPNETRLISESSGLFQPDSVAKILLRDALRGKFLSHVGTDGFLLSTLTCGVSPFYSLSEALVQISLIGLFRAVSAVFLYQFNGIVKRCHKERLKSSQQTLNNQQHSNKIE